MLDGLVSRCSASLAIADIQWQREYPIACGLQCLLGSIQRPCVDVCQRQVHPLLTEGVCHAQTNARSATGNENCLVLERIDKGNSLITEIVDGLLIQPY